MGKVKVLISDLDGTLFEQGTHTVSQCNRQAIRNWKACGNEFWVATGRRNNVRSLLAEQDLIPDTLIYSAGGAYVSGGGKPQCRGSISLADARAVFDLMDHQFPEICSLLDLFVCDELVLHGSTVLWQKHMHADMMPQFHSADDFFGRPDAKLVRLFCIAPSEEYIEAFQQAVQNLFAGKLLCQHTDAACVDIVPRGCTKWDTAAYILKQKGMDIEECAAIGDEEADAGMIRNSGTGFAMEKAPAGVKADAAHVVSSVAQALAILER